MPKRSRSSKRVKQRFILTRPDPVSSQKAEIPRSTSTPFSRFAALVGVVSTIGGLLAFLALPPDLSIAIENPSTTSLFATKVLVSNGGLIPASNALYVVTVDDLTFGHPGSGELNYVRNSTCTDGKAHVIAKGGPPMRVNLEHCIAIPSSFILSTSLSVSVTYQWSLLPFWKHHAIFQLTGSHFINGPWTWDQVGA